MTSPQQPPKTPAVVEFEAMSDRTRQVLAMLTSMMSEQQAADALGVGRNTVHSYVKRIYAVMRVHSRQELRGLLERDEQLLGRIGEIRRDLQTRHATAPDSSRASHVEVRVRIERKVLAALQQRVDNLPDHLAELARREAHRLKKDSPAVRTTHARSPAATD